MKRLKKIATFPGRAVSALTDPSRHNDAMLLFLAAYTAAWTLYGVLAKASQDVHPDMTEIVAWSRGLSFGYVKHPPLAPYIARAWFSIFQYADWAFYLLAIVVASATLWVVWRIALRYLDPYKALAATLLLTFTPFFNFHALKFNANTVMMPVWALTTWWFLISFETRSRLFAALAGLGAGLCMLGKYWSIFLLLGLGLVALLDRRRGDYFRSSAPYITIAAGSLIVVPHVYWLFQHDFAPLHYAEGHASTSLRQVLGSVLSYLAGSVAYAALPLALITVLFRPNLRAARDTYLPRTDERRRLALAFWLPLLLPAALAPLGNIVINSIWSIPNWALFGIVFLSSPQVHVTRRAVTRLFAAALVVPAMFLIAAPGVAYIVHRNGLPSEQQHLSPLAEEVARLWRETTPARLMIVCGDTGYANGLAFYSRAHPKVCDDPRVFATNRMQRDETIARKGIAIVCVEDADCHATMDRLSEGVMGSKRRSIEISRTFMGLRGPSERYLIGAVPPQK